MKKTSPKLPSRLGLVEAVSLLREGHCVRRRCWPEGHHYFVSSRRDGEIARITGIGAQFVMSIDSFTLAEVLADDWEIYQESRK